MRLPATGCFRHRDRLGHRGSRHRIQRPNQVAGPGNSHGCRHRRRDDWRPEDLWPGDVERPLPLTRRPGDGGRGQRRAASAVRNPDRTRGATSASGRCCVRGPVDGRRFRIRSQKAHYATSRSPQEPPARICATPLALGRTTVLGVMWCTKGTLPTELALSQQHTVDRMSDVHPTAVTDNGDPVGIIAGIRISACTGIVCSRPSLPGTNHQPLEGRLQPQARRWSTDQDTSFDKTRSNGRQNRTNYSTNRDQMYDKTGVL
ncbi:Uncharacterised protein [Mycobacterium tuberculosis]|nr:Uncharacterised protein [Mycobacterium tuberculosis]